MHVGPPASLQAYAYDLFNLQKHLSKKRADCVLVLREEEGGLTAL